MDYRTNISDLINSVDRAIKDDLKGLIKAELMKHADEVVEEVAKNIAEALSHQITQYHKQTGDVGINIWIGPHTNPTTQLEREVKYTVKK